MNAGVAKDLTPEDQARLVLVDYLREQEEPEGFSPFSAGWEVFLRQLVTDSRGLAEVWNLFCPPSPHAGRVRELLRLAGHEPQRIVRVQLDAGLPSRAVKVVELVHGGHRWDHHPNNDLDHICVHNLVGWRVGERTVYVSRLCASGLVTVEPGVTDAEVIAVVESQGRPQVRLDTEEAAQGFADAARRMSESGAMRELQERMASVTRQRVEEAWPDGELSMDDYLNALRDVAWSQRYEIPGLPSRLGGRQDSVRERRRRALEKARGR